MFFIVLSFFLAAEQQSVDDSDEINRQMKAMVSFFFKKLCKKYFCFIFEPSVR